MCAHGFSQLLYTRLESETEQQVRRELQRLLLVAQGTSGAEDSVLLLLRAVDTAWQAHCEHMMLIRNIFLILDRNGMSASQERCSIWDMGLRHFCQLVKNGTIQAQLVRGLIWVISKERAGDVVDRQLLRSLLRMLSELQLYADVFEVWPDCTCYAAGGPIERVLTAWRPRRNRFFRSPVTFIATRHRNGLERAT